MRYPNFRKLPHGSEVLRGTIAIGSASENLAKSVSTAAPGRIKLLQAVEGQIMSKSHTIRIGFCGYTRCNCPQEP